MTRLLAGTALLMLGMGIASLGMTAEAPPAMKTSPPPTNPFPSTYAVPAGATVLIKGATVLTGTGQRLDGADVLIANGHIEAVGTGLSAPAGAVTLDGTGKWVTPGIIDIHSHLGVYATPEVEAHSDGNEMTSPVTANVWAEHSVWPQDPGFEKALEGGVTTLQILPGSGNLIGGRSVVLKNVHADTAQGMKFPDAAYGLKMACGENPKRVYGGKNQFPSTRMGNVAGYRQAFADAQDYERTWEKYYRDLDAYSKKQSVNTESKSKRNDKEKEKASGPPSEPKRDLKLETLAEVLKGNIRVHMHCYRADEMAQMLDVADEFGFKIVAFHHAVEAYKLADRLAEKGVCAAMWADWFGFKMEAFDGIEENLPFVDMPNNSCAIVHSDSADDIQRLNQEAAKAIAHAQRVGVNVAPEHAILWLTYNPARSLGLEDKIGTIEKGKNADVVVWNRNPFSVYALAEDVYIDGALVYDRAHPRATPPSDFLLGQPGQGASL